MSEFGRAFSTLKEARKYAKEQNNRDRLNVVPVEVRKMYKELFPRRKKLYHVGSYIDYLNFG